MNLIAARAKGLVVTQQWELGLKWQLLHQVDNDPTYPISMTVYVNDVVSAQQRTTNPETSFEDFGGPHRQIIQLLVPRKFGKVSLQLNPLYLHTSHVIPYDDKNIFALGGAIRIPLSKKIVIL